VKFVFAFVLLLSSVCAQQTGLVVDSPDESIAVVASNSIGADGSRDITIDVTEAFQDSLKNDHVFEVAMQLQVLQGTVYLNGTAVGSLTIDTVHVVAMLFEKLHSSGDIVSSRSASVVIQVSVAHMTLAGQRALSVQELIREVDGNRVSAVLVQEAIIRLDANGNEVTRIVTQIAIAESRLQGSVPEEIPEETNGSPKETPESPESPDSPKSPNEGGADSPNSPHSPRFGGHHHCSSCEWFHKQSFGVRVLVSAGISFVTVLTLYVLARCLVCCCCPASRVLHYKPLAMDEKEAEAMKGKELLLRPVVMSAPLAV